MHEDGFRYVVEQAREAFSVPSIAVAVSWGGETWCCAVGRRGLLGGAVDEDTVYPIASASKAFIATCVMMLVDEGAVELDAPVKRYLPQLELFTPELTEQLTVRDMLCHRSGLPRHDATLVTRADATLEETVDYLRWLEPCWGLRERFHYQNHMFALASLLVGRVSGRPWESVVRERLFGPLGMTRAYTAWREYERHGNNYARPLITYGRVSVPIRPLSTDSTGCAGSLSMNIRDLLRWGQANLASYADASAGADGRAGVDGHRGADGQGVDGQGADKREAIDTTDPRPLIPLSAARELHRPQMPIRPGEMAPYETPFVDADSYGLGWFVETYRGVPLVHHGGTINGFKSVVGFLPEHGCALAVLVNQNASPVPLFVLRMVADAVLGAEPYDWRGFYLRIDAERRAKALREYRAAFARRRQPLPPSCKGVYEHPAYGKMRIMPDLDGPRLRYQRVSNRLRPGTSAPWVLDTGVTRLAIPCAFEGSPPTFCAWLEPELKTPVRFERAPDGDGAGAGSSGADTGAPGAGAPGVSAPGAGAPEAGAPGAGVSDDGTPDAATPNAATPNAATPNTDAPDDGKGRP